jgi:HAD superfamily hydrolase (TIGR01509 family)
MSVSAFIFDMDGLLIDSEPYWRLAEQAVFADLGFIIDDDDCREIMGMRLDVVVQHFYGKHQWEGPSCGEVEELIIDQMEYLIRQDPKALDGVHEILGLAQSLEMKIALASSSPMRLINAAVDSLNIRSWFMHIASAEDETHGKPDPAVYLSTAKAIDVHPESCLVFEDSVPGVTAALAANMKCVAVPEEVNLHLPIFKQSNLLLSSLTEFKVCHLDDIFGT